MTGPINRLRVDRVAAARTVARGVRRAGQPPARGVTPRLRQATVVSVDGGTPPTCTVLLDPVTPGPSVPGIRYAWPLAPCPGDVVYLAMLDGNAWVITRLRNDGLPAYLGTTTTITGVGGTETLNSATFLTVWLEAGRRYRVEGQFRGDSTASNVVVARIRYAAGANPTTSSTVAAVEEGSTNTGAGGARTYRPAGYPLISGSNGPRTFGLSTVVAGGTGTTSMLLGNAPEIWVAVTAAL